MLGGNTISNARVSELQARAKLTATSEHRDNELVVNVFANGQVFGVVWHHALRPQNIHYRPDSESAEECPS